MKTIVLPEQYTCPICGNQLKVWSYKGRDKIMKGHPMMGCRNWRGCSSPWRKRGNRVPWHVWIVFSNDGKVVEKTNLLEHEYPKEDRKRYKLLISVLASLKRTSPSTYQKIRDLYRCYEESLVNHAK